MSDARPNRLPRSRLDSALVDRGLAGTRSKAQGLILSGRVLLDGMAATKCGAQVRPDQRVEISPAPRQYVSRGGIKLEGAFEDFGLSCEGKAALDVGASTGGFTDFLLRRGARRVYAVDVGEKLIDDRLRSDPRVVVIEKTNFRHSRPDLIPEKVEIAVVDVSFISLRHILPPLRLFLSPGGVVLALVKPQFEAGRGSVGKGGVVRDEGKRRDAVAGVAGFAATLGFSVEGEADCRIKGPAGNLEAFLYLVWKGAPPSAE